MIFVEHKLSQSRRILSILMIIFLFVVVVANSRTHEKPHYYGNKIHLLCTYEKPISGCRFNIPGETVEIQLFEKKIYTTTAIRKYGYFGKGFQTGDCGITIYNVTKENEGYATCILNDYNDSEQFETVQVKIFDFNDYLHMGLPKMKILNSGSLKINQTLVAECIVNSIDEYSNILWLLNNDILNTFTTKRFKHEKGSFFEIKSILKYQLDSIDNGSTLKCRTRLFNYSQEFIDSTIELMISNETSLIEPKIGLPFDISIKFFAFPRVLSSRWRVNKRIIYYGKSSSEFLSRELKYLGKNQWEAVLHITNVTDINIHYNYTLQVNDSNGTEYYDFRLDNSIQVTEESADSEEQTTVAFINDGENSIITQSPKFNSTTKHSHHHHYHHQQEQQKGEKSNVFRRITAPTTKTTKTNNTHNNTIQPFKIERRTKYITRKQQQQRNTSISITEMTSVTTSTTTESSIIVSMTKDENTNETTQFTVITDDVGNSFVKYNESNSDEYQNTTIISMNTELNTTTSKDLIEIITIEDHNDTRRFEATIERFFIKISFVTMMLIIIVFLLMLCHYRHQVAVLKTEIIQMNLENYYNQSCLYPSTFNEYSSTDFQQGDIVPFYIKRPLDVSNNHNNSSSGDSDISSNQLLSTYSTNSHLYQSIDVYDIENHVYDEIIHTRETDEEKPNNYENNESFNNETLIPSHCQTLMTIHEEEEYDTSQIQILSKLESTYI